MIFDLEARTPDADEALRYLGHGTQEVTADITARLDAQLERARSLARPRASIDVFPIASRDAEKSTIALEGCALVLEGVSIAEHLDGARSATLMAVTIGMGIERELRRLSLTNALDHALFDAAATTLVEQAAADAEELVRARAREQGRFANARFSPGYGDLPLACQGVLLDALDARRRLGITLSPSLLMTPTKSVTAVIGIFDELPPRMRTTCADCSCHEFCTIHRSGGSCRGD